MVSLTRRSVFLEGRGEVKVLYVDSSLLVAEVGGGRYVYSKARPHRSRRRYLLSLLFGWPRAGPRADAADDPTTYGTDKQGSFGIGEAFITEGVGRDTEYDAERGEEFGGREVGDF